MASITLHETTFVKFIFGVLIVIGAYAAGIVIDRWSDTLLERLFNLNRIHTIAKRLRFSQLCAGKSDPFPEACLRLEILEKKGGLAEHHDYLRTRLRITRAISCLLPAFLISLQTLYAGLWTHQRHCIAMATSGVYVALLIAAIVTGNKNQPPKTFQLKKLRAYVLERDLGWLESGRIQLHMKYKDFFDQAILGIAAFTLLSGIIAYRYSWANPDAFRLDLFPLGLPLITMLVGRSWWRISVTFFTFLYNFSYFKFSKSCDAEKN